MKKTNILLGALLLSAGLSAQTEAVDASNDKAIEIVETSVAQQELYDEMYGVMVVRLDEEVSSSYASGSSEVTFDDFMAMLENSTEESIVTFEGGEQMTMVSEPGISLLDDGFSTPLPAKLQGETTLAYVTRLSELVADPAEYDDFVVIGTTGGELGLVYARVGAADFSANSIDEAKSDITLNVYPNPTIDMVTITGLPAGNHITTVIDIQGKIAMEAILSNNEQLDLSGLNVGTYSINVLVDGQFITEQVQVTK